MNNGTPILNSPKNQKQKNRLGMTSYKITGWLELLCGRSTLAYNSNIAAIYKIYTFFEKHIFGIRIFTGGGSLIIILSCYNRKILESEF